MVTHFNKSPKQWTHLREKMCNVYNGKKRAFILLVLTRWETQVNMIESLSRNRQALQDLCEDNRCELNAVLKQLLWDPGFWKDIMLINNILQPIHHIQYSSEKDGYKLHHVIQGWKQIRFISTFGVLIQIKTQRYSYWANVYSFLSIENR